jgi:protease-4
VLRRTSVGAGVADRVLLELDLGRGVAEAPPASPLEALRALHTPSLRALVDHLRKAASDPDVAGLIGTVGTAPLTLAQSGELRAAVAAFRESGKPTAAWSPSFGELSAGTTTYHLATAFDEVWLQPSGLVGLLGFAAEAVFLRAALDKLGVEPQLHQRHEYKTAADTLMRPSISDAHREMLARVLESATETVVADVAAARGLGRGEVRSLLDGGPLTAGTARERGLVDQIGYRDEAYAAMRRRTGVEEPTLRYVERHGAGALQSLVGPMVRLPRHKPVIGLVQASGPIHLGRPPARSPFSGAAVGSDPLTAALRAAGRDEKVRAVVLRVDSPGGSYVASDAIRREILVLRESGTPVVASMASVAASGGYYIAMPCDAVYADAGTITGSIGVLAGKAVTREALERWGVARETVAASRHAAMLSTNRPFDDDELALLDQWLDEVYDDFTAKAAADRGMAVDDLRAVARGRVWTGADAAERGLVDTLGGLEPAIREACRRAGVDREDVQVRTLPTPNPLQALLPRESSDALESGLGLEGPRAWTQLLPDVRQLLGAPYAGVLTLPPVRLPGLVPG